MSKKNLNKWVSLTESDLPQVAQDRNDIVNQILETQEQDIKNDAEGVYSDPVVIKALSKIGGSVVNEAVVTGDHGYDANNIAMGKNTGAAVGIGPTVMGLVRRMIPHMIGFDICGVQPMTKPTSQVFAFHALYGNNHNAGDANNNRGEGAREAFHPMYGPDTNWSGKFNGIVAVSTTASTAGTTYFWEFKTGINAGGKIYAMALDANFKLDAADNDDTKKDNKVLKLLSDGSGVEISEAMATSYAELCEGFDGSSNNAWNEMSFQINKATVEAKSRQLKGQYSIELAQDLSAVHGMNADSILSEILAKEIAQEIDREILLWINAMAQTGKTGWTLSEFAEPGVFDFKSPVDTRGARWAGEAFKSFIIQVDKESNEIARQTGRGPANIIIASRNVVAMMAHTDMFIGPAVQGTQTGLSTNTTQSMYAGVLAGKYRVYIDQWAREDYFTVVRKGPGEMDAALFYAPYVALTPFRGADPKNFQPVIGMKTRYALAVNPMADSSRNKGRKADDSIYNGMPSPELFGKNAYARRVRVVGL